MKFRLGPERRLSVKHRTYISPLNLAHCRFLPTALAFHANKTGCENLVSKGQGGKFLDDQMDGVSGIGGPGNK